MIDHPWGNSSSIFTLESRERKAKSLNTDGDRQKVP